MRISPVFPSALNCAHAFGCIALLAPGFLLLAADKPSAAERAEQSYQDRNYAEAQKDYYDASRSARTPFLRSDQLRGAGDAAFMQTHYPQAAGFYADGLAVKFQKELDDTSGEGGKKFFAGLLVGLSMASDVLSAKATGVASSTMTQNALTIVGNDTYKSPVGDKNYRKLVKDTVSKLTAYAKNPTPDIAPISPLWASAPGSGIVSILSNGPNCPAVRVSAGVYVTIASCLSGGAGKPLPVLPWLVVDGLGIQAQDNSQITDYWSKTGHNASDGSGADNDLLVLVANAPGQPFTKDWSAKAYMGRAESVLGGTSAVGVHFGNFIFPTFKVCEPTDVAACHDPTADASAVYVPDENNGWVLAGFIRGDGTFIDMSTNTFLAANLDEAKSAHIRLQQEAAAAAEATKPAN
jgi:hypothetical protein